MMLDKGQIENNINWLLSHSSSPVIYLTQKYLLKRDSRSKEMKDLWAEVKKCSVTEEIFSKQKADGSWYSGGSWSSKPSYMPKDGYSAFTPPSMSQQPGYCPSWGIGVLIYKMSA
ncbi:hypothetical protein KAX75_12620 [candidate division WOR-3 bacterium]|nr:hypothetical protein [candidate division WOR-3 bacterium]